MTHKYGIKIPTSVDHAMEIDRKNGNTMWKDAMALEMYNAGVVGSPQVSFPMCTLEIPQKLQYKFFCS